MPNGTMMVPPMVVRPGARSSSLPYNVSRLSVPTTLASPSPSGSPIMSTNTMPLLPSVPPALTTKSALRRPTSLSKGKETVEGADLNQEPSISTLNDKDQSQQPRNVQSPSAHDGALALPALSLADLPPVVNDHNSALPTTPLEDRRLASVRSSRSLATDHQSSSSTLPSSPRQTSVRSLSSEIPRRPPLNTFRSSPNMSPRSTQSIRNLPPQSEPPRYPTPPTPSTSSNRGASPVSLRTARPFSPSASPRSLSVAPQAVPTSTQVNQIFHNTEAGTKEMNTGSSPSTPKTLTPMIPPAVLLTDFRGDLTQPPTSSMLRLDPSTSSSSHPQSKLSLPGTTPSPRASPYTADGGLSGDPTTLKDIERNRSPSLPTSSLVPASHSPTQRRASMASISSTSTFRVRRKPTPSELGDDASSMRPRAGSTQSDSRSMFSEGSGPIDRRGSNGSVRDSSRQLASHGHAPSTGPLDSLAEAQTPALSDAKFDFTHNAPPIPSSQTSPTVMVDGQAFILGDLSSPRSLNSGLQGAGMSHDSPLARRFVSTGTPLIGAKSTNVSRSVSLSYDRTVLSAARNNSDPALQKSTDDRKKGLGDGQGLARRPGSSGAPRSTGAVNTSQSSTAGIQTNKMLSRPTAIGLHEGNGHEMTVAEQEAAAGPYAIDPPTREALALAASLTLFSERGELKNFGEIFENRRTLVCFLRHWFCPMCQEYAMSMRHLDPLPLQRANLGMIVVGQGHPHVIAAYKKVMGVPEWIPMYADPTRKIYHALGMTKRTNDPGPACAKPDYITMSMMKGSMQAVKKGLFNMPIRLPGDTKLLGGEFILGPGLQSSFTHRMVTTRGHLDVPRILIQAGCDLSLKTPKAIDEEGSRPGSTRSLGRSTARRAASQSVRKLTDRFEDNERRSASTPTGKLKASSSTRRNASGVIPAVPKLPLSILFATKLDGTPRQRPGTAGSLPGKHRKQQSANLGDASAKYSLDAERRVSPALTRAKTTANLSESIVPSEDSRSPSAGMTQSEWREHQRKTFAAGPSSSPTLSGQRLASVGELRRSFEKSSTMSKSTFGRTSSQNRGKGRPSTVDASTPQSLSRSPSASTPTPATRRNQLFSSNGRGKELLLSAPLSPLAIYSSSPLAQEVSRSLSGQAPNSANLEEDSSDQGRPKLVRQLTQSKRPEVVTPVLIREASTVEPDSGVSPFEAPSSPEAASAPMLQVESPTVDGKGEIGLPRKISHRQLRLEGGPPSVRSLGSPPASPRSPNEPLAVNSHPGLSRSLDSPLRNMRQGPTEGGPASSAKSMYNPSAGVQGETARVGSREDESEEDSADTSIAEELREHEQALRHQASMGSLTSSRLSSPCKPGQNPVAKYDDLGGKEVNRKASSPTAPPADTASGNGGGASFLGDLDMIDGFVRHRGDPNGPVTDDDSYRHSLESSGLYEETEPVDSDSDMEHESGWVRPSSSISSPGQQSISHRLNGNAKPSSIEVIHPRSSEESRYSTETSTIRSSVDSLTGSQQRGLSVLTPSRGSFRSSLVSAESRSSSDEQADGLEEDDDEDEESRSADTSARSSSLGRFTQSASRRESDEISDSFSDADDYGGVEEQGGTGKWLGGAPASRSSPTTPHRKLDALEEQEEEGEDGELIQSPVAAST